MEILLCILYKFENCLLQIALNFYSLQFLCILWMKYIMLMLNREVVSFSVFTRLSHIRNYTTDFGVICNLGEWGGGLSLQIIKWIWFWCTLFIALIYTSIMDFWVMIPWSMVEGYVCFGVKYCLHLQGILSTIWIFTVVEYSNIILYMRHKLNLIKHHKTVQPEELVQVHDVKNLFH
jgi:hypothetical protein